MNDPNVILYVVIGAAVVRISAVLLLTYGVKVLLCLHGYHSRMSAFYRARVWAICILSSFTLEELDTLSRILSPDHMTIEPTPESSAKDIMELLKAVSSKGKE
jgi:hypothetical protein